MLPVPELSGKPFESTLGKIPKYTDIPDKFKTDNPDNKYLPIIIRWNRLEPEEVLYWNNRDGVDKHRALTFLGLLMNDKNIEPQYKLSAASYLLMEWFEIPDAGKGADQK